MRRSSIDQFLSADAVLIRVLVGAFKGRIGLAVENADGTWQCTFRDGTLYEPSPDSFEKLARVDRIKRLLDPSKPKPIMSKTLETTTMSIELAQQDTGDFCVIATCDGHVTNHPFKSEFDARVAYEMLKRVDCLRCGESSWSEKHVRQAHPDLPWREHFYEDGVRKIKFSNGVTLSLAESKTTEPISFYEGTPRTSFFRKDFEVTEGKRFNLEAESSLPKESDSVQIGQWVFVPSGWEITRSAPSVKREQVQSESSCD